jgi:dienelactone hydrolase
VGYSATKLIDEARTDPFDPKNDKRVVMISLFYPIDPLAIDELRTLAYMPPKTTTRVDAGLAHFGIPEIYERINLHIATATPEATRNIVKFPLVLFSPALARSRHEYNAMAQNIAGEGYAVVTMDHAYDALIVEYPDGSHVSGKPPSFFDPRNSERRSSLLATRVEDARFVLTQLGDREVVEALVPGAADVFDVSKAAIFGHSFGGSTAVSTLMKDSRFVGGINMDGSQYHDGPLVDVHLPVLLFGRGPPSPRYRINNPTWPPLWAHLKGSKWELVLSDSECLTFCDMPLLVKLAGVEKTDVIIKLLGYLDGKRAFEVVTAYIKAFLGFALRGEKSALLPVLEGDLCLGFPEVTIFR